MTFFFAVYYFQHHFTRIAKWKRTGFCRRNENEPPNFAHATAIELAVPGVLYTYPPTEHTFYPRCLCFTLTGNVPDAEARGPCIISSISTSKRGHYNALLTVSAPVVLAWFFLVRLGMIISAKLAPISVL